MPTTMVPKRKKKTGTVGGSNSLNESGGNFTESAMDEFLAKQGLYRKPIAKDGSCLFRAVSEQVHNCQARHLDVRNECIDFMRQNRAHFEEFVEGAFDHHLFKLQNPKEWAGQVEITALSQMYSKDFVVYQDINSPPTKVTDHGYKDKILLCYSNGNHYDIIYNNQYQQHAAMCQSLLFEVLYNRVFAELDKKDALKKGPKFKGSVSGNHSNQGNIMDWVNGSTISDGDMIDNGGDDDGWTEVKSKARAKHDRQSKSVEVEEEKEQEDTKLKGNNDQKYLWELRRSVDPHLYRNIPLEVWEEDKHTLMQKDLAVAASLQYKNGERCSVKLGPPTVPVEKSFNAIIKEDYTGSGNIQVFVPELSKRHFVPIQSISSQQGTNYKELSGHYQKDLTSNGPASEEGAKDDSKFKKRRLPRNRRGPGKGSDEAANANEDVLPRGRGKPRDRFNRRRFPGGKDDRNVREMKDEEEARFMAEQIKLVELQEKDPLAFPALSKTAEKVEVVTSPVKEEKVQEKEKTVVAKPDESSPAGFWSKFNKSPRQANEEAKPSNTDGAKQQELEVSPSVSPVKADNESLVQPEEGNLTKEQPEMLEENEMDSVEDKDAHMYSSPNHSSGVAEKDIQTPFHEPLPSKQKGNASHRFEVKIPETVTSSLQPLKITQTDLTEDQEESAMQFEQSPAEKQYKFTPMEQTEPKEHEESNETGNNDEVKGMAELSIKDNEPFQVNSSLEKEVAVPNNQSPPYQDASSQQEEPSSKPTKPKVNDPASTPERKTVTFSEETKEIPDVLYGQKGILIFNGTNKPSQASDQGFKATNPDDYNTLAKENSKQDYMSPQDGLEKDPQAFQTVIVSEGLQSPSPTAQQQAPLPQYLLPLSSNVQIPVRPSFDRGGGDLPQDIPTLRHFYNLGCYHYMMMANQPVPLPMMYMYQGPIQEPMISQAGQPVATMPQQQLYAGMQHQQLPFQHHGLQTYPPAFPMPPQTTHDSTSPLDRTTERSNQPQLQPPQQIQMPHQQQSGHFQQPQNHVAVRWGGSNNSGGGFGGRHYNHKSQHHLQQQSNRPNWSAGSGGNPRQPHNNKQNRKQQSAKVRPDHFNQQHYSSSTHNQNMSPSQSGYYTMTPDHQSKGHSTPDYYQPNMYPSYASGMPNVPHHTR